MNVINEKDMRRVENDYNCNIFQVHLHDQPFVRHVKVETGWGLENRFLAFRTYPNQTSIFRLTLSYFYDTDTGTAREECPKNRYYATTMPDKMDCAEFYLLK